MKRRHLTAILFFLLSTLKVTGGSITVGSLDSPIHLKPYLLVFEDTEATFKANELIERPELFVPVLGFNLTKRKNIYWSRAEIVATVPTKATLSLTRLSHTSYYLYANNKLIKEGRSGTFRPRREITSGDGRRYVQLDLDPGINYTLLIRGNDIKRYPPTFDFNLYDRHDFMLERYRMELFDTGVFGALAILLVYTLLSWIATRSRPYLWLSIFIIGIGLYDLALGAYLVKWFFPNNPILGFLPTVNFLHIGIIGLYLLLLDFWKIKENNPALYRVGIYMIGCIVLLSTINTLTNIYTANFYLSALINQYLAAINVGYVSLVLVYSWHRLNRPQRFLSYGVILFLITVFGTTIALFVFGETTVTVIPFVARILMLSVVLLFLTGLKEELRKIERDKATYLKELTELQKHQNTILEEQVLSRTRRLRERNAHIELLINELNHRVKNNLQLLYSLNKLQLPTLSNGPAKNLLQDNISRIRAMMLVNDNFSSTAITKEFGLEAFVADITSYSAGIFDPDHRVSSTYHIAPELLLESRLGLPFGLILSELVTNSYKHAFTDQSNPMITITVQKEKESIIFDYADNGSGVIDQKTNSFGVQLIHDLTRQLKGSVTVSNENGHTYRFIIPTT